MSEQQGEWTKEVTRTDAMGMPRQHRVTFWEKGVASRIYTCMLSEDADWLIQLGREVEQLRAERDELREDKNQLQANNDALAQAGLAHEGVVHVSQDRLEELKHRAEAAEAKAALADEIAVEFRRGPSYFFDPKDARDWLARYDVLNSWDEYSKDL